MAYCDLDCFHCWRPDCTCPSAERVSGVYDNGGAPDDWKPKKGKRKPRDFGQELAEEYYAKKKKMLKEIIAKEKELYERKNGRRFW